MSKCQNSCPHVTYNLVVRGQIVLSKGIYYGENLESKRMKSYWDRKELSPIRLVIERLLN